MGDILPRHSFEYLVSGSPGTVPVDLDPEGPEEPIRDVLLRHDAALRAEVERMKGAANRFAEGRISAGKLAEELGVEDKHGFKNYARSFDEEWDLLSAAKAEVERLKGACSRALCPGAASMSGAAVEWVAKARAAEAEVERLRERLDQYEAYAISVASALDDRAEVERLRAELENERRTVAALTPAANYCLEYKPLLLKAEAEVARLQAALEEIERMCATGYYGTDGHGYAVEVKHIARAALEEGRARHG